MTIFEKVLGSRKGWQCNKNPDGSDTCIRFKAEDGGRVGNGTQVTIGIDEKTCSPILTGDVNSIMDDDLEDIKKLSEQKALACKRGIA